MTNAVPAARRRRARAQRGPAPHEAGRLRLLLPKGLYTRSLLIVIIPMIVLQAVIASVFLDRHWEQVTYRLSAAVAGDVDAVVDLWRAAPTEAAKKQVVKLAHDNFGLDVTAAPPGQVPAGARDVGGLLSILKPALTEQIASRVDAPFWIDTDTDPSLFTVHVELPGSELRITGRQSTAYASNSHIFLVWMVAASLVLIAVAILFLRNQIRPIQQLADAAEAFGKGREVPSFRPRGAREVRRAASAFLAMKTRIERQIEQRTTMLAGVSHDLRTVLTRFKLELALIGDGPETAALSDDVDEMTRMLEGYLAFARGDAGEAARPMDAAALVDEVADSVHEPGCRIETSFSGEPTITARPDALKRCLGNLVINAARFAREVRITARHDGGQFVVHVDDDGPGIPADQREEVFRPFLRLDAARNQDHAGSGLGLTIARDVARGHGGDLTLGDSPLGGLRATLHIPA
ncbi:MAG TPA: ATP-binding protein [Hyphomicrobiales bacterium]|nr:ATP-binding protein [Hyphomicrobiales bacterium]